MKSLVSCCSVLLLLSCGDNCNCPYDGQHVRIKFTNHLNSPVDSIRIYVGKINFSKGTVVAAFNDNLCMCFESPGENEFSVKAELTDGTVITSKEYYAEGGYRFRALVKAEGIYLVDESNY